MVGVTLSLCSFMQSLSWAVAGIGAFATTGALVLVCFLLLLLIVFFVIEVLCSILQVAPALQALSEGCK